MIADFSCSLILAERTFSVGVEQTRGITRHNRFTNSGQKLSSANNALRLAHDSKMSGLLRVIRHPAPANVDPAVHKLILTAIHERRLLRFRYHDKDRIVEPHDYGIQKGIVNLFTYQTAGESSSSRLPDWRKFAVLSMSSLKLLDETFTGSRLVPSQKHQEWDVVFARVDHS
jgi:predicted DNA-binding transcriptional regulator YafY